LSSTIVNSCTSHTELTHSFGCVLCVIRGSSVILMVYRRRHYFKCVGLLYSYQLLSNTTQDGIKELLGACLHAEVFLGNRSNILKDEQDQTELLEDDKDFPDFPNQGLPLWQGLSQFIVRSVMKPCVTRASSVCVCVCVCGDQSF